MRRGDDDEGRLHPTRREVNTGEFPMRRMVDKE
jgi:hypothetical protein